MKGPDDKELGAIPPNPEREKRKFANRLVKGFVDVVNSPDSLTRHSFLTSLKNIIFLGSINPAGFTKAGILDEHEIDLIVLKLSYEKSQITRAEMVIQSLKDKNLEEEFLEHRY